MSRELAEELVTARLRRWAEESARPLVVEPRDPPSPEDVAHRLREATALWVLCIALGEAGPR